MSAQQIQDELEAAGNDVEGVVAWSDGYYVVGETAESYPKIGGKTPADDPSLSNQS